jgi:toxin ParE1/3/4
MGRVIQTVQALEDVLTIWRYIAIEKQNASAADRLVIRFEDTLSLLSDNPEIGTPQFRFRDQMRSFTIGSHVLLYEPLPDGVLLLRVVHGARRFEGLFKD